MISCEKVQFRLVAFGHFMVDVVPIENKGFPPSVLFTIFNPECNHGKKKQNAKHLAALGRHCGPFWLVRRSSYGFDRLKRKCGPTVTGHLRG